MLSQIPDRNQGLTSVLIFMIFMAENDCRLDEGELNILAEYAEEIKEKCIFANGRQVGSCFKKVLIFHSEKTILKNKDEEIQTITAGDRAKELGLGK